MAQALNRALLILGCAGLVLFAGCAASSDWMPLRKGKTWRYLMKDAAEVMEVKCTEPRKVGDADGWLVSGSGGESVFAWDGNVLRASRLGAMDFDPPIGLLQADKAEADWQYKGTVTIRGTNTPAEATLQQAPASIEGKYEDAMRVELSIKLGGNEIEVTTIFAKGIGIVEQEQRNNGRTVSRAQLTNDSG